MQIGQHIKNVCVGNVGIINLKNLGAEERRGKRMKPIEVLSMARDMPKSRKPVRQNQRLMASVRNGLHWKNRRYNMFRLTPEQEKEVNEYMEVNLVDHMIDSINFWDDGKRIDETKCIRHTNRDIYKANLCKECFESVDKEWRNERLTGIWMQDEAL